MSDRQRRPAERRRGRAADDVGAFLEQLEHPRKAEVELLRAIILSADPRIQESVKWNAPSFALDEHFATFKLRPVETVQLVLHTGAKVRPAPAPMAIDDPGGLLAWAAPDRCLITFADLNDIRSKQAALVAILQQWIAQL
jgi:hypothetical protein